MRARAHTHTPLAFLSFVETGQENAYWEPPFLGIEQHKKRKKRKKSGTILKDTYTQPHSQTHTHTHAGSLLLNAFGM